LASKIVIFRSPFTAVIHVIACRLKFEHASGEIDIDNTDLLGGLLSSRCMLPVISLVDQGYLNANPQK
jgi:hypothetical protein